MENTISPPWEGQTDTYFTDGAVLLIDKPLHWTSFDVVNKLRAVFRHRLNLPKIKVGHAGTLDPMATGLLIVCTGKFTKRINEFQDEAKEYTGKIMLGSTRPSYDMESEIDAYFPTEQITPDLLEAARKTFLGDIEQYPPMFSAIKVDGVPLYEQARKGKEMEVKSRPVTIYDFDLTDATLPEVTFRVLSSKGTYIRSLAHDFGKAVQSGGHLTELRRTKSGGFDVKNAYTVEQFLAFFGGEPERKREAWSAVGGYKRKKASPEPSNLSSTFSREGEENKGE